MFVTIPIMLYNIYILIVLCTVRRDLASLLNLDNTRQYECNIMCMRLTCHPCNHYSTWSFWIKGFHYIDILIFCLKPPKGPLIHAF